MTDVELLAEWLDDLASYVHRALDEMSPEQLAWQPDAEANSIGVTVWHMARWLDILGVMGIDGKDADQEQWFTRGWAEKTRYDPRGIGTSGLGAVTGYLQAEVRAIPAQSPGDLLAYYDQVSQALQPKLLQLTSQDFARPMKSLGADKPLSLYEWTKGIVQGCFGHIGEIFAIRAMYKRAHRAETVNA